MTQDCPPCIYVDSKGQTLCYAKVTGTKLCPFVNTTADCGAGNEPSFPPVPLKGASLTTTVSPTTTAPVASSSGAATGLTVLVILMALIIGGLLFLLYRQAKGQPLPPFLDRYLKPAQPRAVFAPHDIGVESLPHHHHVRITSDVVERHGGGARFATPVMGDDAPKLSACYLMEPGEPSPFPQAHAAAAPAIAASWRSSDTSSNGSSILLK
ncbi:Aste57867_12267 [Aphanomyces stellatus]|uniref:Aste57867_12267 protein n=1 Tax=Aphanomyces stellatus TaxID=120398 RepID=A0A485KV31_9STRA|nr:hypothetical protein As57867_012222 [Aphanomyces stellatus]VFT89120.1 Aste57867_12267 [Aphanomyces stellatus]